MAITNSNELNEMLELALGGYWIERGLPTDKNDLDSVESYFRSSAEVLMSYQETMGALQQGVDVDPGAEKRMWGGLLRNTTELANIFLFVADTARSFANNSDLQAMCSNGAKATIHQEVEPA